MAARRSVTTVVSLGAVARRGRASRRAQTPESTRSAQGRYGAPRVVFSCGKRLGRAGGAAGGPATSFRANGEAKPRFLACAL